MLRTLVAPAALLALLASACSSAGPKAEASSGRDLKVAREHAYTRLVEVRFGTSTEAAGYLVEFSELPLGIQDERPYKAGMVLVQDIDLQTIGFLTPGGQAFTYDPDGHALDQGYAKRDENVRRLLGGTGAPVYIVLSPVDSSR